MPPKKKSEGALLTQASRRKTAPPAVMSELIEPSVTETTHVSELPARGVKGKTGLTIRPEKLEKEASASAPTRTLESVLLSILDSVPAKSTRSRADQVRALMSLRYASKNEPLLSLDILPWIHEVAGLVTELGFDETYSFLKDMVERNIRPNEWVVGSPLFAKEQEAFRYRIRNLTLEIEVKEGIYTCGKCGSKNTISLPIQLRGGDEPMTDVVTCLACRHKFHG